MFRPDRVDIAPGEYDNDRRIALVERRRRQDRNVVAQSRHDLSLVRIFVDQEIDFVLQAELRQQRRRADRDTITRDRLPPRVAGIGNRDKLVADGGDPAQVNSVVGRLVDAETVFFRDEAGDFRRRF